jgi:hypothetical protein
MADAPAAFTVDPAIAAQPRQGGAQRARLDPDAAQQPAQARGRDRAAAMLDAIAKDGDDKRPDPQTGFGVQRCDDMFKRVHDRLLHPLRAQLNRL